ncbi:MAG: helix-turn-helix domain-containing protein [Deltaproteobacteria bacterium]|jgi:DNA-binding transcriptional MerR regulator|nr:helix-turn-helix domain-containing protein [Deltaproteobacteria bacterium]
MEEKTFSLDKLCALTGLSRRTARYYIQIGLIDRPVGEGRGAHYTERHLEELVQIKKLTAEGFSLEAVRRLLREPPDRANYQPSQEIGDLVIKSHVLVAPGIELTISSKEVSLTSEEIRRLIRAIVEETKKIEDDKTGH